MRPLGFTLAATLLAATVSWAQQPGTPGLPPGSPVVPAAVPAAPNNLDMHLNGWERTMREVKNFRVEIARTTTDSVFKKERKYDGVVLCMKPNFAILRLNYTADITKMDYEAFICNGKSFFHYNGNDKTITEWKLPNPATNPGGGNDNIMLDFLSGLKAKEAKQRFEISLLKEDEHYIYLNIKPLLGRDKQDFQQINLALYGPKEKFAYLPARVIKLNPNGDQELWDFLKPDVNIPGIEEKHFQYTPVNGFTLRQGQQQQAQPMPPLRPGQPPAFPGANGLPSGSGTGKP